MTANLTDLQAHIDAINEARQPGDCFSTPEAEFFYETYGIVTPQEFDDHMDLALFSDWYKERYGYRYRGPITIEEARDRMALWAELDRQAALDEAESKKPYVPEPRPANNPFHILRNRQS